jgi:2-polyprenyl-3-methyl-5-hydroxy-6-metoxy-1,4-benzoquinol methylase
VTETAPACWICDSTRARLYKPNNGPARLEPEDLRITDDRYGVTLALWTCEDCGFIHADAAEVEDLVELYSQLEDTSYRDGEDARARQMRWLLELAKRSHPSARTGLDIGAASGLLVGEGRAVGLEMVGVEPSHSLVQAAREERGLEVLQGVYPHPELEGQTFDLVFLVDVIEHVSDPLALLRACGAALAPGGRAIVVTPDIGSPAARMLRHRWWHLRLAHVGYFDANSFAEAAKRAGLHVCEQVRAKWFFPVGYLARRMEQYLPVRWLNNVAEATPGLRWVYGREIPLNLHDSWVFVLEAGG